jgi:hypothetical protein
VVEAAAGEYAPEYVESRRVLLDALDALHAQRGAFVLAGAQAIYLRTGPNSLPVADHTVDGDLALDPARLDDTPLLPALMKAAGFELSVFEGATEPGIWQKTVRIEDREVRVPIDLLVPAAAAAKAGRRGVRLGPHGNRAARKIPGLEPTLVDNGPMLIRALEPGDPREHTVRVAGPAALLVAKLHKLSDRLEEAKVRRIHDKDAADVLRLMQTTSPAIVGAKLSELRELQTTRKATAEGLAQLEILFGNRGGAGIAMAARSLREAVPQDRVKAIAIAYSTALLEVIR